MCTIPRFIKGVKTVTARAGGSPEIKLVKAFFESGIPLDKSIRVKNISLCPEEFIVECFSQIDLERRYKKKYFCFFNVEVVGVRDGKKTRCILDLTHPNLGIEPDPMVTGAPMSIGIQMLARSKLKGKGVVPPESYFDPETFFYELAKRGIKVLERLEEKR